MNRARAFNKTIKLIGLTSFFALTALASPPKKILILYSSIGMGHISASKAIEESIRKTDPDAVVIQKDIRDFISNKFKKSMDEKAFWYVVKNHPNLFDKLFHGKMAKGNVSPDLPSMVSTYDMDAARNWINTEGASTIVATNYGAAEVLSKLRSEGLLKTTSIAWLHTDYFTGYFPRIANAMDKTFLGSKQLKTGFENAGATPEKLEVSGIPVNPAVFTPTDRNNFMASVKLNPEVKTIVLATGGEGLGDFPKMIDSILKSNKGPIQIVAVCARNEKNKVALEKLKPSLGKEVDLRVFGLVPNADLLNYIKSSDIYITKSGGLSPTEAFAIGKPTILLDIYGGHERENALRFETDGLAIINRDLSTLGEQTNSLMEDKALQEKMKTAQLEFRNSFNIQSVTDFALAKKDINSSEKNFYLGIEGGTEAQGTAEAIEKLNQKSPADIEIILSYPQSFRGKYFDGPGSNPFGHLAVRVGDTVYTANHIADAKSESTLLYPISLKNYLYGIERENVNGEHASSFGLAYGRDNISLRIKGLSPEQLTAMHKEAARINSEFKSGNIQWIGKTDNCADFTHRLLQAGGFRSETLDKIKKQRISMPLDIFDGYLNDIQTRTDVRAEIVSYTRVSDSQNMYKTARFPLSVYQLKRSVKNYLSKDLDPVEKQVSQRISFYPGDIRAHLEDTKNDIKYFSDNTQVDEISKLANESVKLEQQLETLNSEMNSERANTETLQNKISEIMAKLPADEKSKLISGQIADITNPEYKKLANSALALSSQIDSAEQSRQNLYDKLVKTELEYFMHEIFFTVEDFHMRMVNGKSDKRSQELSKLYNQVKNNFSDYLKNKNNYGLAKDGPTRTRFTRLAFELGKRYFDLYEGKLSNENEIINTGLWIRLKIRAKNLTAILRTIVRALPYIGKVAYNLSLNKKTAAGEAPVTEAINELLRKVQTSLAIHVDVKNKENLPKPKALGKDKVVNIVVPTHRDAILDAFIMSNLGLGKALLVMAPDQFAPKAIANAMDKVDTIISVGRGSDLPINRTIEQLNQGKTDTILIYPEGSINAGIEEIRPLREKFADGLIRKLIEQGYKVNITPVTYENSARFGNKPLKSNIFEFLNKGINLTAQVHETIPSDVVSFMFNNLGPQSISRQIRATWLEQLSSNKESLMGMIRLKESRERVKNTVGIPIRTVPLRFECLKNYL